MLMHVHYFPIRKEYKNDYRYIGGGWMAEEAWVTSGFEGFRGGAFGNAGQNLYVSRSGVLQRIHQYDLNRNGFLDLVFCNSQAHWERVPAYVYTDPLNTDSRLELPAEGAWAAAVADLNGDGYDDLILGCVNNGVNAEGLNAIIYYGSSDGWSERFQQQVPAPSCTAVAAGDFNGDGKPDLAFICTGKLRVFYQSELGFEPKRFIDPDITGETVASYDIDRDGYGDLIVRSHEGIVTVYWGGPEGITMERSIIVPVSVRSSRGNVTDESGDAASLAEYVADAPPLVSVVMLDAPHIFMPFPDRVLLVPVTRDRSFSPHIEFACPHAMAAAVGDINGDGFPDLVFACREQDTPTGSELSRIYWGSKEGFDSSSYTTFKTFRACDAAVGDLDGSGCDDIVICQNRTADSFTTESLVYRGARGSGSPGSEPGEPVRLLSHDARRAFVVRSSEERHPQVVLVNHFSRTAKDDVKSSVYFGSKEGYSPERRQDIPGSGAVEAICCDITDNGYPDIILANASEYSQKDQDQGSFVLLNGPGGFGQAPDIVFPTSHAHGACCADLNRDGYLDLIFAGFNNPDLTIYFGSAEGFDINNPTVIRMEHGGIVYDQPRWIYLADLNNNGWLDLVVPQIDSDRSFILRGGPEGFSMERMQFLSVFHAACVRAADLTGNGYLDLLVGGHRQSIGEPDDSFVYIYWNGPEGLREDRRMLLPSKAVNSMLLADFNRDGNLDLFAGSYADTRERDVDSYIYWNRGGGRFSLSDRTRLPTHSASGCIAADFNENGWIDLAVANHKVEGDHVGWSSVWWNSPHGFSEERMTRLPTEGPHGMTAIGPGNIADRGPEEYYISAPFELPDNTHPTTVSWTAEIPAKTWIKAQVRTAKNESDLKRSPWMGNNGPDTWFANHDIIPPEQYKRSWIQYRLALGAKNSLSTPRVRDVRIGYTK
jgi:hypothetical protein